MRYRILCILSLIFIIIGIGVVSPFKANAVTSGLTVGMIISQFEDSLTNIIGEAGYQGKSTIMEGAQSAILVIEALKKAYSDVLDKTMEEIDKKERKSFEDISHIIEELNESIYERTDQISNIVSQLNVTLSNIPFSKGEPKISKYEPLYFVPTDQKNDIKVNIFGTELQGGEPFLKIGNSLFSPSTKTSTEISFIIPIHEIYIKNPEMLTPITAELRVFKKSKKMLFFSTLEPWDYKLTTFFIPEVIGSYKIIAYKKIDVTEREPIKTQSFRCESPHCGKDKERFRITEDTQNGWYIDTKTIEWHQDWRDHASKQIINISPNGFEVTMKCRAYDYLKTFGECVAAGKKGVIHGYFTYTRYRTTNEAKPSIIKEGVLKWATDIHLALPPKTEGYVVELNACNGDFVTHSGVSNNKYFKTDYNQVTNAFIIKPNEVSIALK